MTNLFADRADGDEVAITLADGSTQEGAYMSQAGFHFLQVPAPTLLGSTVIGPFLDVVDVRLIRTRKEVLAERSERRRGALYPGRAPKTADDFQYRLETLARASAREENTARRSQLELQFHDIADQVKLAKGKRKWMLAAAKWALTHNEEPRLRDLWFADVAAPGNINRPRTQDFDPNPKVRRKRVPLPNHVRNDPRSVPNMLSALRSAGLKASISLAGDPVWDRAVLQVDFASGCLHRFDLHAVRLASGEMRWTKRWGSNGGRAGDRRHRAVVKTRGYAIMLEILNNTHHKEDHETPHALSVRPPVDLASVALVRS